MRKTIPFPAYYDDVPIDLSFVFENEKPAGKHGFLKADKDRFVFEDQAEARFWGTNFNGGANFPEFEYAEKIAKRLSKIGINLVRFHQLDSEWNTPNIYQFTKGKRLKNTQTFDPESLKRLDYLIYCLKREGIYCYLDIFTYRKFKSGDGVENAIALKDAAKPYSGYNRHMIELQKKNAYDFWTHVNPYTGLAYKDDPVFVLCEIVNESTLFSRIDVEPYAGEFRRLFRDWLKERDIKYDWEHCDLNGKDPVLIDFKVELQQKYYTEMISYMKQIGVKIPITGTNYTICSANCKAQTVTDFCDNHAYIYDWRWGENEKRCKNIAVTQMSESVFGTLSLMRVFDKPFFVSEWDMPWPNEYRAESPLLFAAVGALQDWSGFAIHTYAYGNRLQYMNMLGKEVSSSSIGGVPYREGIFSTWNDPAKFGLFYHAALITRRKDVSSSKSKIAIRIKDLTTSMKPAFRVSAEMSKIAACYNDDMPDAEIVSEDQVLVDESKGEVRSDTGELYRNWNKNYGIIDTPRTKCAYGFLQKNSPVELNGLTVESKTDFAVIAMSSLTDDALGNSDNILLTTVGRAMNTDAKFEGDLMTDYGRPPILIEVIEADIKLKTERQNLRVWAVNAEGFFVGEIPTQYENGVLSFTLGDRFPSMYYLIQEE